MERNMIKIEQTGVRRDGEKVYCLIIDDRVVRENLTFDEAIEAVCRKEESET